MRIGEKDIKVNVVAHSYLFFSWLAGGGMRARGENLSFLKPPTGIWRVSHGIVYTGLRMSISYLGFNLKKFSKVGAYIS